MLVLQVNTEDQHTNMHMNVNEKAKYTDLNTWPKRNI